MTVEQERLPEENQKGKNNYFTWITIMQIRVEVSVNSWINSSIPTRQMDKVRTIFRFVIFSHSNQCHLENSRSMVSLQHSRFDDSPLVYQPFANFRLGEATMDRISFRSGDQFPSTLLGGKMAIL
jgi:hypothetical protein